METRREFLRKAKVALLIVPIAAIACGSSSSGGSASACDGVFSTSSVAQGHTHTVCVDQSDLTTPPSSGMTFTTSVAQDHTHTITLSQAQLQSIGKGQEVTVTTSVNGGHTHMFMLVKMA